MGISYFLYSLQPICPAKLFTYINYIHVQNVHLYIHIPHASDSLLVLQTFLFA